MKRISLLLTIIFILVGCSSAYDEHVSKAEAALENGDFENALQFYNLALLEENNPEAKDRADLLNDYDTLQKTIENEEWAEASELAETMLNHDAIFSSLQEKIEEETPTIEEELEQEEQLASELKTIEDLIQDENVEEASAQLSEIESSIKSEDQQDQLDELSGDLEEVEKRIAEKEQEIDEAEQQIAEKEQQEKELEVEKQRLEEQAAASTSLQETYLQKAAVLDAEIIEEATRLELQDLVPEFYGQYYTDWDELLNEVWGVLGDTMSSSEFETLKAEQNEWIQMKEQTVEEMPKDSALEREQGMGYLAFETQDRTYYLIENYMD